MNRWQLKWAADSKVDAGHKKKNLLLDITLAVLVLFLTVPLLTRAVTGYATFFGYKPIYILTDSMEPVIPAGSWVVAVPARGENIAVGDVAAYRKENGTRLSSIEWQGLRKAASSSKVIIMSCQTVR